MKKALFKLLCAAAIPAVCLCLVLAAEHPSEPKARTAYAGSSECRSCHDFFYKKWEPSHHGKAMQPFTPEFAQQYLTPQTNAIVVGGTGFVAEYDHTGGWMTGTAPDGSEKRYPMQHVLGGKNVFFFLTELDRGHLQVMPVSYNVRTKEWYNTTASMVRHFDDGIVDEAVEWTDRMLTFNAACFDCHVSQLQKNYNAEDDSYHTTWVEPGINCETCHGPGKEHIRVCQEAAAQNKDPEDLKILRFHKDLNRSQRDATCFSCHAKMSPITGKFIPGEAFFDHYDLTAYEDPDFHPDGRHLGENYTITHWLANPCLKSGKMECITCHTSSGRFRFKDNPDQACLPCHESRVANVEKHSHHKKGTKGALCISCHMPARLFSNMNQSDHSHLPPVPAATIEFGSPNACNICHKDQDAKWADKHVTEWHGKAAQAETLKRGRMISTARNGDWDKLPEIIAYLDDPVCDQITATSLLRLLQGCPDNAMWPTVRRKLEDPSPLVRSAAAATMQHDFDGTALLLKAAQDPVRLVRIRAGAALMSHPVRRLAPEQQKTYKAARQEYWESLTIWPDRWSTHYNQGIYHDRLGDREAALAKYEKALELRDDVIAPLVNAAMIYARKGNNQKTRQMLKRALATEPGNASVNFNIALLEAESGNLPQAEKHLRTALKSDPPMAQAAYNLGVMLCRRRDPEGLEWCRKAAALPPHNPQYAYTHAFFALQFDNAKLAERILREAIQQGPAYADNYFLLAQLYQHQNRRDKASQTLKAAAFNKELPQDIRRHALQMEKQLRGTR